ncbi:hypothetical protein Syun_024605 [Stephania yunnanensis]|uniref:Dual specificity protein phosphatase PHS1 n=1 Tax=Stephania yunnanensis TaxID=152371 RepID=A0AAP0NIV3_9MAGN
MLIAKITQESDQEQKDQRAAAAAEEVGSSSSPYSVGSRVLYLLGDITAGPAYRFAQWLDSVRKRSGRYRSSGFPNRPSRIVEAAMPTTAPMPMRFAISFWFSNSLRTSLIDRQCHVQCSLSEYWRLGMIAAMATPIRLSSTCLVAVKILGKSKSLSHDCRYDYEFDVEHIAGEPVLESTASHQSEQITEISLWERLGKAAMLDIESSEFSWHMLSSLHHTEHSSSTEHSEDEMTKVLEVTVNSGGVVFFALFNRIADKDSSTESAAVIKISSSRMATQSERMGYELAKWMGVRTPQARVVHHSSPEWQQIKDAAEKARDVAVMEGDEVGEMTCSELLEALELSRCLFLMNVFYWLLTWPSYCMPHSLQMAVFRNLFEGQASLIKLCSRISIAGKLRAFESQEAAEKTAAALGRILMLDLVIRNEDRLPCRQLGWRGNPANLLLADKADTAHPLEDIFDSSNQGYSPRVVRALQKGRRSNPVTRLSGSQSELLSHSSDMSGLIDSPKSISLMNSPKSLGHLASPRSNETESADFNVVAIDSGIPRRPPAGKRANDHVQYPKLVELLLNSFEYSSSLLSDITGGKVGCPLAEEATGQTDTSSLDVAAVVSEFRGGFRAALRDLQGFHIFLLTLYQKLDSLLRTFLTIINKSSPGDSEKDDSGNPESPSNSAGGVPCSLSPVSKERCTRETSAELSDSDTQRQVDSELSRELEQWNEMLRTEAVKLCLDNNFNAGFFEGSESNIVVDAYELKVRLEHVLERIALISDAANTEKPSSITSNLFIGGALAARSVHTLQHLGITHILCLCSNEIGQSDSQYLDLFEYKNFSIFDNEEAQICDIFDEAFEFIDGVERSGGKVLVHCFEGRSRSATLVLAYLMLRKNLTLLEAWNTLKKAHRRAQPNDGFAKALLDLDWRLHGKASMEWQKRKPMMRVCPICGKNAGLSSSSLKLHLQKSHRKLSSGSVDSAMTMEIHKILNSLKLSR